MKPALVGACAGLVLLKQQQSAFVQPPRQQPVALPAAALASTAALAASQPASADEIGAAAKRLSDLSYPFLKEVDWNSLLYLAKPGGSGSAMDWLKAVDDVLVMGNAMDPALVKKGVEAHLKGITNMAPGGNIKPTGLLPKGDYEEINAAIGRMIASVPEDKTMAVYNSFSKLVGADVGPYLMSTVNADDAKSAYEALLEFKDVVKAHPISHDATESAAVNADISSAAEKLSSASYPLIKEVDWTSDLFTKPLPGATVKGYLDGVVAALKMGIAMDPKALHGAVEAHHKAIGGVDAKGVPSESDYAAINGALGQLIKSVPSSKTMDVYNAFSKIIDADVGKFNMALVNAPDARAAYSALLEFKDVVKAAQR
jgi:hypothetical protein